LHLWDVSHETHGPNVSARGSYKYAYHYLVSNFVQL